MKVRAAMTHLRYMKGEAPLGKTELYTASSAFLIREDSTRRSTRNPTSEPNKGVRAKGLTIDKQQEYHLLPLIIRICEMWLCWPRFWIVCVFIALSLCTSLALFWRLWWCMQQLLSNRRSIQKTNSLWYFRGRWTGYLWIRRSCLYLCQRSSDLLVKQLTFLHTKDTDGLWTAYFVTTSKIRPYSSEELRKAESRVGVL